jgi:hypothetical protein
MLRDEYVAAEQLDNESLRICRASGGAWGIVWSLYALAFLKAEALRSSSKTILVLQDLPWSPLHLGETARHGLNRPYPSRSSTTHGYWRNSCSTI